MSLKTRVKKKEVVQPTLQMVRVLMNSVVEEMKVVLRLPLKLYHPFLTRHEMAGTVITLQSLPALLLRRRLGRLTEISSAFCIGIYTNLTFPLRRF